MPICTYAHVSDVCVPTPVAIHLQSTTRTGTDTDYSSSCNDYSHAVNREI